MYLHIGNDCIINEKEIIAIFNLDAIKKSDTFEKFYDKIKNKIIDISNGKQKTLILMNNINTKGYITNISSVTLRKR